MTGNYWEHPDYGREDRDDKAVTVTLSRPMTPKQWDTLESEGPQLDMLLTDLSYCDGGNDGKSFSHDWENTTTCPRGLIGYAISESEIRIWGSEAIPPEYLASAARYVLSEVAKTPGLADAGVACISTTGMAAQYTLGTLTDAANSIGLTPRADKAPDAKPGTPSP